ncbi:MAG: ATP-dependent RNA helicase HrpA [Nitrospirae bacterium]|nr:ATP-dependent RNA helicase HrpA [Nitrospirota bacterium]
MDADRARLARRLKALDRRAALGQAADGLARLAADAARSRELRAWRAEHRPLPEYPDLPVSARRDAIAAAIRAHPVVVVAGETGSGKTTQLPKICLDAGRGIGAMIGHTQPRRIAARSLATRIAEELHGVVGEAVGYKVRFSDHTGGRTFVKVMTDGILLAETQADPLLTAYDTLIIDEAHERSLNIDFLLGYIKNLLPKRPDLRVVITSATIDTARFAAHFDDAPVIEVSGRTYPVDVWYRPEDPDHPEDQSTRIVQAVDELSTPGLGGDILVFLSGEREIREAAEALRKHHPHGTEILPLFARQSAAEQQRVFHPGDRRRIVLATNVAETSLTVPRIRYVIDPGTARISRYSTRAKVQRLPVERVSQASANQRKGRCGRLSDGICVRLYSADDFLQRPEFTEPEIRRTNLAAVILRMLALNLGDIAGFPFVEPPDRRQIGDGFALLTELGAVDAWRQITPLGRKIAAFNVDPRLARMILAADGLGCVAEVLVLVAALSVPDPRERPMDDQAKADQAHARFADPRSDFVALLNLWRFFEENSRHLSQTKLRKACKDGYLSYLRLREWHDVHRELCARLKEMGIAVNTEPADYEAIHKALLSGCLSNVGEQDERRDYRGARGTAFTLFPGSGLAKKPPRWLVAAELVETGRLYARTGAEVAPEWIEQMAGERLKRHYAEPRWEEKRGAVVATERTSLYGLVLCPARTVNFGPVDPAAAREVFIRQALVPSRLRARTPALSELLEHNRALLEQADQQAAKARSREVGVDEEALFAFFDQRLPATVHDVRGFEKWFQGARQGDPRLLQLTPEAVLPAGAGNDADLFPDQWTHGGLALPLEYHFQLGHKADGVTVRVPVHMLAALDSSPFEWLVPGMIREKVGHLLKNLPKRWRKEFMPWPHWADRFARAVPPEQRPLTDALAAFLYAERKVAIPREAWAPERLPEHHQMRFAVMDANGRELATGRDLIALKAELSGAARQGFARLPKENLERERVTEWDFGPLPEAAAIASAAGAATGYPALVAEGGHVAVRLLDTPRAAARAHRDGVVALVTQALPGRMRQMDKLVLTQAMLLAHAPLGTTDSLRADITQAALNALTFAGDDPVRTPEAFAAAVARVDAGLIPAATDIARHTAAALAEYQKVHALLAKPGLRGAPEALADIRAQFGRLVFPGFVAATPLAWLPHLARHLKAIIVRLERLDQKPAADLPRLAELGPLQDAFLAVAADPPPGLDRAALADYRFLLEELRVSLFAPELKTSVPVSTKRLAARWKEITGP